MKARLGSILAAAGLVVAYPALAQPAAAPAACTAPSGPPDATLRPATPPAKPVTPACVSPGGNAGNCKKAQIDGFNKAVTAYNAAMVARNDQARRYVDALNAWNRAVADYSNCEIQRMNAEGAPAAP